LFLHSESLVRSWVDDANHAIVYARTRGAAIVKDWVCVIHSDCECWWIGDYCIDRLEAREEANLVHANVFIGDARKAICGTDNAMVRWVENVFDIVPYFC
jgi:hypothetical protein